MDVRPAVLFVCLVTLPGAGAAAAPTPLERPAALAAEIGFWRRVYTEVTTSEGFVHDDRRLDIVYETVRFPGANDRARRAAAANTGERYQRALRSVANGKRANLSREEARVIELWGADADEKTLLAAAGRVRFQLGQADRFVEGLVRAGAWDSFVRQTVREAGLPPEIAMLPHVESSYNPAAYSHAGAAGMWQFMSPTGKRFLRIDHVMDERLDPYESTRAAVLLLRQNYEITRSWPLAITAYNHGASGMRRAMAQLGTSDIATIVRDYDGRSFGFASRNFYVALLAAAEVVDNADRYFGRVVPLPPDTSRVIALPSYIPADTLGETLGVPRPVLAELNPSLKKVVWSGGKYVPRGFGLRIPAEAGDPVHLIAAVPAHAWQPEQVPDLFHTVQRGETISAIAPRYGARISELIAINGLSNRAFIREGQRLILPAGVEAGAVLAASAPPAAAAEPVQPMVASVLPAIATTPSAAALPVPVVAVTGPVLVDGTGTDGAHIAAASFDSTPADSTPADSTSAVITPAVTTPANATQADATLAAVGSIEPVSAGSLAEAADEPPAGLEALLAGASAEQSTLLADPSDYSVARDGTIQIQEGETIGHYAEWLGMRASDVRRVNGMHGRSSVRVGRRLRLEFARTTPEAFEAARIAYHQSLQGEFFAAHRIVGTADHVVRNGESIWLLAERRYNLPVWLLRQYNPDLDLERVHASTRVVIPVIESRVG